MSARNIHRVGFTHLCLAILSLALLALGGPRAAAQTGGGSSEPGASGTPIYNALPITASLDFLTTPTLGGKGSVIWCAATDAQIGSLTLAFTLESADGDGNITTQTRSVTLNLNAGSLQEADFPFTLPQAGSYRVTARADWSDAEGTISNFYTLAFNVADGGTVSVVPDVEFVPIDSGAQYEVLAQDAAQRLGAAQPRSVGSGPAVLNPGGSSLWRLGGNYAIQWQGISASQVRIDLVRAGKIEKTIAKAASNTGNFMFTVPDKLKAGNNYTLVVSAAKDPSQRAESSGFFTISDVRMISPNARNLVWNAGKTYTIAWQGLKAARVKVELYLLSSLTRVINASTANKGKLNWTIPTDLSAGSDYWIKVTEVGVASPTAITSESVFAIANPQLLMPNRYNSFWKPGEKYSIKWSGFVGSTVKVELLRGGKLDQVIAAAADNNGLTTYTVPSNKTMDWKYQVRITSLQYGTQSAVSAWPVSVANPKLIYPSDAGLTLHRSQKYTLQWSGFAGDTVKLEFYKNNVLADVATVKNNGKYIFTIPKGTMIGSDYWFRILGNPDTRQVAVSAYTFSIAQ